MTVTFTATPELDLARVAIRAEGGVVGDSFYVLRRDRAGSTMVRETSETGLTWQADPAATKTNQHTNPRWANISGLTELRRNLATNPRCAPGTTSTERRRNLAAQSSSDAGLYGAEFAGGGGTFTKMTNGGAHGQTYNRQQWNTASTSAAGGTFLGNGFTVAEGRLYYLSTYVRTSINQVMSIGLDWRNSSGTLFGNSRTNPVSVTAYTTATGVDGTKWTRISGFVCAPPTATNGTIVIFAHPTGASIWPAGSWLDTDSTLAELVDTTKRPYRVNRCADPSFEQGTTFVTQLPGCTAASDTTWARTGTKSLKLTPTGSTVDSSTAIDGDTGAFRMGMYAGGTFTASGYFRQLAPQAAPGNAARVIKLYYKNSAGVYIETASAPAANTTAVQRVSVTMTIPAGATEAFMRVYNGSQNTAESVWWDDIQLEDGTVATSFFKGDTVPGTLLSISWNGNTNGSMSMEYPSRIDYFDGSTGFLQNNGGEDLIPSWTGTVGDSQSILTSRNVPLYAAVNANVYSARIGTALAIIPTAASSESYAAIEGDGSALRLGMSGGKTYTVRARLTIPRIHAGNATGTGRSRKIVTFSRAGSTGNYTETASAAAPNAVGDYDLTVTFTTVASATEVFIRLYNGSDDPNDVAIWSRIQVMEKDGVYFDGNTTDTADLDYSWAGTVDASASIQKGKVPTGASSNAMVVWSSIDGPPAGVNSFARFEAWQSAALGIYTTDIPAAGTSPAGPKTGILWARAKKVTVVQPRWRNAAAVTVNAGPTITLQPDVWTEIRWYDAAAPADSGFGLLISAGGTVGDIVDIGQHAVVNGNWTGDWFDGSSQDPAFSGWNGVANASTSYLNTAALPITVYDYEARQGLETSYALTSDMGIIGDFLTITIPAWGSWLKDPFRPFMNVKILWNSDSAYTRKSDRVLLRPKGGKFPVPQWDKRSAPSGTVRIATETNEESRNVTSLLDAAGVIMIDVPEEYGVPVRYVSVGDVTGSRVGEADRNLTWEARYFDLEVDEIDVPVGEPVGQAITYESVGNYFGSYLALAASVASYDELAAGTWAQNV